MKKEFTLIELLVVIAILGILITLLMPSLMRVREKARVAVCASNERQISLAMGLYLKRNNGFYPVVMQNGVRAWDDMLSEGLGLNWSDSQQSANFISEEHNEAAVLQCPSDGIAPVNSSFRRSYAVNMYKHAGMASNSRLVGVMSHDRFNVNLSVNLAQVNSASEVLMLAEQWRDWNLQGAMTAQISGYGYGKLKMTPGSGWWENYQCHDQGKANLLMVDGSVSYGQATDMLNGAQSVSGGNYLGSHLDHRR